MIITMKSFKQFLIENEQQSDFRIKVACECDSDMLDRMETALEKWELKSLSKPKRTPIQEHPMDFQTLNNSDVNIMDATVAYPVTANELYSYLSEVVGIPANMLVVINKNHPEEIAREEALKEEGDEYVTKLDDAEYKDADKVKVEDHFGDKYNENMLKDLETRKYEFAKE
jgi:hypothetical protein